MGKVNFERKRKHLVKFTDMLELNVAERRFYIWKLELWWIAFDKAEFYPEGRKHLKDNWFWRQ